MSRGARRSAAQRQAQGGLALLGAMLLCALVISVAYTLTERSRLSIARTTRVLENAAATHAFRVLEDQATMQLRTALERGDTWHGAALPDAAPLLAEVDGAEARGRLRELQGLFNLNNLVPDARGATPYAEPALPPADGDGLPAAAPDGTRPDEAGSAGSAVTPGTPTATSVPGAAPGTGARTAAARQPLANGITTLPPGIYFDPRLDAGAPEETTDAGAPDGAAPAPAAAADITAVPDSDGGEQALAAVLGGTDTEGPRRRGRALSAHEVAAARFSLLLTALELDQALLPAILDWLDADSDTRFPGGAEDDHYLELATPYRAANRPFADVSELRLVRGVTPAVYERLAPFVCVLPARSELNINTAPAELLMSLGPGLDRTTALALIEARTAQPFTDVAGFTAFPLLRGRPLLAGGLGTESQWYTLTMDAHAGDSELAARSLLARQGPNRIAVVRRVRGYFDE